MAGPRTASSAAGVLPATAQRRATAASSTPGAAPHGAYVSTRSDDHPLEAHVAPPQQLAQRVELVLALVEDAADAGVDEHLEAVNAGGVGDVDVRAADADAVLCRLRDRVDLGVDGAEAVLLDLAGGRLRGVDQAAHVGAVREPSRGAVVAGGEDVAIADDDRAHLGAQARRALGHL